MTKSIQILAATGTVVFASALLTFAQSSAVEPGATFEDEAMAINQPYEYAWRLFLFLNRQAKPGVAGEAEPSKTSIREYDDDQPVIWESWASATGGLFLKPGEKNTSEVYRAKGEKPVEWSELQRGDKQSKHLERTLTNIQQQLTEIGIFNIQDAIRPSTGPKMLFIPPRDLLKGDDEIRLNRAAYEHVRTNYLYSVEGLQSAMKKALETGNRDVISFAPMAKEVKARWVQIKESDKPRYHWRTLTVTKEDGSTEMQLWGLSGLHTITKDLPNWFWTDFEHVDQEPQAIKEGRPSVDPTTREYFGQVPPSGSNGVRNETKGSKWQYYRLRGTQIDFTDKSGKPTQLANTLIEPIEAGPSSCITCHAKATASGVLRQGTQPPFVTRTLGPEFLDGLPDPTRFLGPDGKLQFIQTDFVWSMPFRAHSEKE